MKIASTLATLACILISPLSAKIAMCSMAIGDTYWEMMLPTYFNKAHYACHHQYDLYYLRESLDPSRPHPWSKIKLIQEVFEEDKYTWVFWTDADSFIMNFDVRLKMFIDGRYDMIVASDCNGINTGQFFIRDCKWSRDFLKRIYAKKEFIFHPWWEQMSIMDELAKNKKDRKHVKILPQRALNSYPPESTNDKNGIYKKGDFIIHFAGCRGEFLIDLIAKYGEIARKNETKVGHCEDPF